MGAALNHKDLMAAEPLLSIMPHLTVEVLAPPQTWLSRLTPFLAALLGAGIGGATGFFLQRSQFRNQRRILDRDREDLEETLGLGVLFKLNRVHTTIFRVREQLEQGVAAAAAEGHSDRRWAYTREFATDPPRVEVTIDDLVFVKRLGDVDAMNGFMDLQEINNTYVDTTRVFGELKKKLSEKMIAMATPVKTEGDRVGSDFTEQQIRILEPEMARLNKLLADLDESVNRDGPEILTAFRRIQQLIKEKLGARATEFELPDPANPPAHAGSAQLGPQADPDTGVVNRPAGASA